MLLFIRAGANHRRTRRPGGLTEVKEPHVTHVLLGPFSFMGPFICFELFRFCVAV